MPLLRRLSHLSSTFTQQFPTTNKTYFLNFFVPLSASLNDDEFLAFAEAVLVNLKKDPATSADDAAVPEPQVFSKTGRGRSAKRSSFRGFGPDRAGVGAVRNETGGVVSDAALYAAFALLPGAVVGLAMAALLMLDMYAVSECFTRTPACRYFLIIRLAA